MRACLPNFFSIKQATDLIRIGRDYDGGYLVSNSDIKNTDVLIGLGIKYDWSFEEDFLNRKKVSIYAYDASVNKNFFLKQLIKSAVKIYNLKIFMHWLNVLIKYRKFFSLPNVHHIQKFVGLNTNNNQHCSFMDIMNQITSKNIFLKIDIEGSEYRFLDDIVANKDRITGMVIEFHDVDMHLQKIEDFINRFNLNLVHVHANNFGPIRADDKLPTVLELTFSKYSNTSTSYELPHTLDMPNNRHCSEYEISINSH